MSAAQSNNSYYTGNKAEYVRDMFAGIAGRYDLMNSILSFKRHYAWRRKAVALAGLKPGDIAVDVCTGTGDFAVDLFRAVGSGGFVAASDFCEPMLRLGADKTEQVSGGAINMMLADAQKLPYRSNSFDCATVGFGIRNVSDTQTAFSEMARVVRPGGRVICLEFNQPKNVIIRTMVNLYERRILPIIGSMFTKSTAYTYLPESIQAFHSRAALTQMMQNSGLTDIRIFELNFGSVCIHMGTKS